MLTSTVQVQTINEDDQKDQAWAHHQEQEGRKAVIPLPVPDVRHHKISHCHFVTMSIKHAYRIKQSKSRY